MPDDQAFLGGAAWLALAGVLSKALGALYRIPLARLIGPEGLGLFGMAYPLYGAILALSTAGVPVAVSKLIAEKLAQDKPAEAGALFKVARRTLIVSGLIFGVLTALLPGPLIKYKILRDERALWPVICMAPAVVIVSVNSALRGYFQGLQDMRPTAVSQVAEQLVRAVTSLLLSYLLLPRGLEFAAAGAAFGAFTGGAAAWLALRWYRQSTSQHASFEAPWPSEWRRHLKKILAFAIPISLSSLVLPLMQSVDVLLVPVRLEAAGYGVEQATALFGQLTQMAVTLVNLPVIITASLAVSLVPAVSAAQAEGNPLKLQGYAGSAVRLAMLVELPAAVGLFVLATPIMGLVYGLPEAGPVLAVLAASCIFLGLQQSMTGILQGLGRSDLPVISMAVGAVVKVILTYILTGRPALGIRGAAWATVATFAVAAGLNGLFIQGLIGFPGDTLASIVRPGLCAALTGVAAFFGYRALQPLLGISWATVAAIGIGAAVYGALLLVLKALQPEDLATVRRAIAKLRGRLGRA